MTECNFGHATLPSSAPTSRQRAAHFKGIHLLETDDPLSATLKPNEQTVLRTAGSYEERAKELNVPVGTLKSRLHRARVKLVALRSQTQIAPH
jgi:Sigma-70, region 4